MQITKKSLFTSCKFICLKTSNKEFILFMNIHIFLLYICLIMGETEKKVSGVHSK